MGTIRIFRHYVRTALLMLALLEALLFGAAFYVSVPTRWWIVDSTPNIEPDALIPQALLVSAVMVLCMAAVGLYEAKLREGIRGSSIRIVVALLLGSACLGFISYLFPALFLGRGILALTFLFSLIAISLGRLASYFFNPAIFRRRILVLGAAKQAQSVFVTEQQGFEIIGYVPVDGEQNVIDEQFILERDHPLDRLVQDVHADEIVIAVTDRRGKMPVDELLTCKMQGVEVVDLLTFFEREKKMVRLDMLNPSWLVFSDGFRQGAVATILKRVFDVIASLMLLAFAWPIMIVAALAIFVESGFKGPVLYSQIRVGEEGRAFEVLKFRSMRTDAESDGKARWATENDSRITKVGHFIRKTRIDELPQIFNVLRGDMSFVGPRPERPEFVAVLAENIEYYAERHRVKPGLTGWAQLCYPYGSSIEDAKRKLEYDLYYTKNHSLFLDLVIMLQTAEVVLFRKGAV